VRQSSAKERRIFPLATLDHRAAELCSYLDAHSSLIHFGFSVLLLETFKVAPLVVLALALFIGRKNTPDFRSKAVAGLLGALSAAIITRLVQHLAPARLRPSESGFYSFRDHFPIHDLSSFPSDTVGFACALALGIWAASRPLGWFAFAWVIVVDAGAKLVTGQHYLSDVIAGGIIGLLSTFLILRARKITMFVVTRADGLRMRHETTFWVLVLVLSREMWSLGNDVQIFASIVSHSHLFR
jgi:membrane-associated phospholipid phosphatase